VSGVRNMAKGLATIASFRSRVRELPLRIRAAVAKDGEAILTQLVQGDFDGARTVFGDARPVGVNGKPLSLVKSGRTRAALSFVAIGTILRAQLPTRHAKYLIGKYRILPSGRIPAAWSEALLRIVREHFDDFRREVGS
jgi:hypothetical protein